jgi:ribosomal protein S18 acetylase RimI-like enzyme
MSLTTRIPTEADVPELKALIDLQESTLDSRHKPAADAWPIELLRGHNDSPRNLVWTGDDGKIVAWASMQPDEHRHRVEIELFRAPGFPETRTVWEWCLATGAKEFDGWTLWPTSNFLDDEIAEVFRDTGFSLLRKYHILTRKLGPTPYPELPEGTTIDVISTDDDFVEWHAAHQDAFSQHFGFTPRPADKWIPHFKEYEAVDPDGRFLLRVDGHVAGFVTCTNDNEHENGGFVDLLGVRHEYQGRSFGELLLRWAFAYCASRGFTDVDLTVDTGNESRALALYERVGFDRLTEFHLYDRG